jgi:hypothetical protein
LTTIAVKGGIVAADSLTTFGSERSLRFTKKLFVGKHAVYAVTGIGGLLEVLADWHESGADPRNLPVIGSNEKWTLLVAHRDGATYLYHVDAPYPQPVNTPFGLGSGGDYALGAMDHGASADEAVAIACRRDTASALPVQSVNIAVALGLAAVREAAE